MRMSRAIPEPMNLSRESCLSMVRTMGEVDEDGNIFSRVG